MSKIENSIGWCDETGNKVTGCSKVSAGCKNCYAERGTRARVLRAAGRETWGDSGERIPVADFSAKLRRLNKLCICDKCHEALPWVESMLGKTHAEFSPATSKCFGKVRRIRLFADSNSDWLDEKWPKEIFSEFLAEIHESPNVDAILLTKRIQYFEQRLRQLDVDAIFVTGDFVASEWLEGRPPKNLWLGVSVENQAMADLRIPQLLKIPAAVRFLSCEPLLGPMEFSDVTKRADAIQQFGKQSLDGIDWAIVGGESGADRRDCGVDAIGRVVRQCVAVGVPVYVKQDCAFKSGQQGRIPHVIWNLKQFPTLAQCKL